MADVPYFTPIKPSPVKEMPNKGYPGKTIIHENPANPNGLTAVVFRDSFSIPITQFISPHFKRVVYIWTTYDENIVKKENPDIVIESFVERTFR